MSWKCRGETYGCSQFCEREFDTHSGRYKHEQASEMKNNLNANNLKKIGGVGKSKGPSDGQRAQTTADCQGYRLGIKQKQSNFVTWYYPKRHLFS